MKPVLVPGLPIRLNPPDVNAPSTSPRPPAFAAIMLLLTVHAPLLPVIRLLIPAASLLLIVLLETFSVSRVRLRPGPPLFPVIVLFVMFSLLVVALTPLSRFRRTCYR